MRRESVTMWKSEKTETTKKGHHSTDSCPKKDDRKGTQKNDISGDNFELNATPPST